MKSTTMLSAAALFAAAGMASAQVTPTAPFTGPYTEGFETQGSQGNPCISGRVFNNTADICDVAASAIIVTSGWGFFCSIPPYAGNQLAGSAGGPTRITFDVPVSKFGGYFGTNSGTDGAVVSFYDGCNNLIGTQNLTTDACNWTWNGWQSTVGIKEVVIVGNNPWGGGFIDMDDLEYQAGGGAVGACCIPANLSCGLATAADCACLGGTFRGVGTTCETANCPSPGACCLQDGSCVQAVPASCQAQNGVYRGDSTSCATANCPPGGACCQALGACSTLTQVGCTAAGGVYRGDGSSCASAACPGGFTMDCNIPATFTDISSTGTPLQFVNSPDDDTAAFTSSVTNALVTNPNLFACTNGHISDSGNFADYFNTNLPAVSGGMTFALFPNWDDLYVDGPGQVFAQAVVEGGVNVHIVQWNNVRTYAAGPGSATGTFQVKIFGPGGPALAQYIYQGMAWDGNGDSSTVGVQWLANTAYEASYNTPGSIPDNSHCSIIQVGAPATCYANCDTSTQAPCLNVLDFSCFLNKFAAQDTYANCDQSTQPPVLNVLDFSCFLNKFAAGCSGC